MNFKNQFYNLLNKNNKNKLNHHNLELDNNSINKSKAVNSSSQSILQIYPKKNSNLDNNKKKRNNFGLGFSNPYEEEIEKISEILELSKRNNCEIENNKLIYQTEDDIITIGKILKEDNLLINKGNEISFLDIICFILKKNNKRIIENELLKIFFLKIEKLVAMFKPLNVSMNDMMGKLVGHIKYEKKIKDNILFKEGDKGDKFYIILKGEVGILIQQERSINCTPIEYLKCLMFLYLYQERSLLNKMILINRENLNFDERCFITLMDIFKYYHFYKDLSISRRTYRDVIEFVRIEIKISKYLHKKNDFLPEECFHTLDLSYLLAEELYNFYCRVIDNIQIFFWTDVGITNNKESKVNNNNINNPTNLSEFCLHIKSHEQDERKFKTQEFFDKLYLINEISNNFIRSCNVNDYIQRISGEEVLNLIRKDSKNSFIKMYEEKKNYKYYKYIEVNQLKDGNIFGELALINPSKKRTATVIIKEDCHLGVLNKEAYDISIKNAQDKLRIRNLLFFTNGPIFNGIANNYFLNNYFFRFKKRVYNSGEVLFHRGEIRTKIIFIINGELQLSSKMTLKKLSEIILYLNDGKNFDDGGLSKKYCRESLQFKKFYEEAKNNFRLYVLKDKEIAGLDDMTKNNVYLFDCTCVSLEPTEVYELDYKIFEEAAEDDSVKKNNDEYVSMKKEILVNRLYGQRDSIAKNEYNRIKAFFLNLNLENICKNEEKNNNENKIKTLNNFFPLNKTTFNKKIFSFSEEPLIENITTTNIFNKKFPPLNTTRNMSSYADHRNKSIQNNLLKTDNDESNSLFSKNNLKKPIKLKDSNQIKKEKSLILLEINKEKSIKNDNNNINLIKANKSNNITRIESYIKNNNIKNNNKSFPKKLPKKISYPQIKKFKKNITPSAKALIREYTRKYIEPNKTPYIKTKFIFNNQEIFEPLLKNKFNKEKRINMTLKNEIELLQKSENNKESLVKDNDIINNNNNDNENCDSSNRNKNKRYNFRLFKNKKLNKFIDKRVEENYKDIFFIDCLCLDKWEEKTNKHLRKEKAKLRGKKLLK